MCDSTLTPPLVLSCTLQYDGAGPDAGSAGVAQVDQDGGLYQEPEMGATGGYMDVPAGGGDDFDEGGTSGYVSIRISYCAAPRVSLSRSTSSSFTPPSLYLWSHQYFVRFAV